MWGGVASLLIHSSCFPMENCTHPGLLTSPTHLSAHSLGRSLCFPLRITSKRWEEVRREGSSLPWAIPEEKQLWTEDWQQKGNMGISGWGLRCGSGDTPENLGQTKRPGHCQKRTFYLQCKSYSFNLMECIWVGWEWVTSLGGALLMNTFNPSVSFIHPFSK